MAKCSACRSADTHPLCGENVCCVNCGHTGPAAVSPSPTEPAPEPDVEDSEDDVDEAA